MHAPRPGDGPFYQPRGGDLKHRHIDAPTWWITIEDCTGETVNEFGLGHPDSPPMPLGKAQLIAQGNLPCPDSRATIYAAVCHVDGEGVIDLPDPPLEPRFPAYKTN